jgi:hypothetical protein
MQPTGPTEPTEPAPHHATEPQDTVDSADPGTGRSMRWRPAVTAGVAVLALLAAGAVGAALASTGDEPASVPAAASSTTEDGTDPRDRMERFREWAEKHGPGMLRGRGHAFGPGFGHGLGVFGGALHGEYVAPAPDGGYRTVVVQRGEVTEVSDSSLTVVSEDDFTTTYRIDDDTLVMGGTGGVGGIDEGDRVSVAGVRSGGTVRAVHVTDLSAFSRLLEEPGRRNGATPAPSATTEGSAGQA